MTQFALPLFQARADHLSTSRCPDDALFEASQSLATLLLQRRLIDGTTLRTTMAAAFGASDASGAWSWKQAFDAVEAAQVLALRASARSIFTSEPDPRQHLAALTKLARLCPMATIRSEESQNLQQFSTPLPLAFVMATAARIGAGDVVLEPSAGTGMLAVWAHRAGAAVALNELSARRAALLHRLFRGITVTRHDAEQIHDRLDPAIVPSVVLMNPPFSASPGRGQNRHAGARHLLAALARLAPGGRLVVLTLASFDPAGSAWCDDWRRIRESANLVCSIALPGDIYARHGTSVETRLSVLDKGSESTVAPVIVTAARLDEALRVVLDTCGDRTRPTAVAARPAITRTSLPSPIRPQAGPSRDAPISVPAPADDAIELAYEIIEAIDDGALSDALYQAYAPQRIRIAGAASHPTPLVQSAALASMAPPVPGYRPMIRERLIRDAVLSAAQLESLIYAGEAHETWLKGAYRIDDGWDGITAAADDDADAVRLRRGWFLGDGTGAGKGRQVAAIILDHWLRGRRRAVWLSKSDKLIEDARRDWIAVGGRESDVQPLSAWKQGKPVTLASGILFVTYATLRTAERKGKPSRLRQLIDWLGQDFNGVIVFDEAHAMANAAGEKSTRGGKKPSLQGQAGLRLQNAVPAARVVYVSATGATRVANLAYASRLGLWQTGDFPFASRGDFIAAMESGGIAAMEMVCRDLKALGLYAARNLSFAGVEYDILEHALPEAQVAIYDRYADAFQIIHRNLAAALEATNITGPEGTYNRNAKAAALSAFESAKQRFFNHLLIGMKGPTLLKAIEQDLADGHAAVVQIVSTNEAVLDRRLAEVPASERDDLSIDITPREYILDYLVNSFPTQLHTIVADDDGNLSSIPAVDERGNPIESREAVEARDRMVEQLCALPAVPGALDQLLHHFGHAQVAEVTGRSKRVLRSGERQFVESRPASANLGETEAFMDDNKRILVFSDAGGTGRSYHADLAARNQRRRIHYLLEAGWRADQAIQGLGRTHRTNQACAPLFRPVTTNVKGERRFISTIARRLDSLGALTRGQRQTGGQNLFRPEDNLESEYARDALRGFFRGLHGGKLRSCSLALFQELTGLRLTAPDGTLNEELPQIHQFLNRILALRIALQNAIFAEFEAMIEARIDAAITAGSHETGIETIQAERLRIVETQALHTDAKTGAETRFVRIERIVSNRPLSLDDAFQLHAHHEPKALINASSKRPALMVEAPSLLLDDGAVVRRIRLVRPLGAETMKWDDFERSHWQPTTMARLQHAWMREAESLPPTTTDELLLITGLLLPVWHQLPAERMRVYRLKTDDGRPLLGRLIHPEERDAVLGRFGETGATPLTPAETWAAVMERGTTIQLAHGASLRRSRFMGGDRMELVGYAHTAVDALKALGCITEIATWRLQVFVPDTADRERIIAGIFERHPPIG
jgi:predicted RNA methylase